MLWCARYPRRPVAVATEPKREPPAVREELLDLERHFRFGEIDYLAEPPERLVEGSRNHEAIFTVVFATKACGGMTRCDGT